MPYCGVPEGRLISLAVHSDVSSNLYAAFALGYKLNQSINTAIEFYRLIEREGNGQSVRFTEPYLQI